MAVGTIVLDRNPLPRIPAIGPEDWRLGEREFPSADHGITPDGAGTADRSGEQLGLQLLHRCVSWGEPGLMPSPVKADNAAVRFPPPLLFAGGVAFGAWLDHLFPLFTYPAWPARIIALACAAVWLGFDLTAFGLFRRSRTSVLPIRPTSALVTTGVYRITRNPMYLGLVFGYLAATLWFVSVRPGALGRILDGAD